MLCAPLAFLSCSVVPEEFPAPFTDDYVVEKYPPFTVFLIKQGNEPTAPPEYGMCGLQAAWCAPGPPAGEGETQC